MKMEQRYFGAYFMREADVVNAAAAAQEKGFIIHDVYTPYPIHGIEKFKGFGETNLPWIGGIAGVLGLMGAFIFQFWASWVDWPLIVGGKPMNSWPAFVPVAFEVLILLAGLISVIALLSISRLWPSRKAPVIHEALDDKFLLVLREVDAAFDRIEAENILKRHGAAAIWDRDSIHTNGRHR